MVKYIIYLAKVFLFLLVYSNSLRHTYNGTVLDTSNGAGTPVNDSSDGVGGAMR